MKDLKIMKKEKFAEQLHDYFKNTPKEVLDKEWKEIHEKFNNGPDADEYIKNSNH